MTNEVPLPITHAQIISMSDPLFESPFVVLGDYAVLSMVLGHADEEDVLCAMLTCSTFRDALIAWRQARGQRIPVTGIGGVASSSQRLKWVRELGAGGPRWVQDWNHRTCARLAQVGGLEALQWARANGCRWDTDTCARAARGGHLEVLQWARANGCPEYD